MSDTPDDGLTPFERGRKKTQFGAEGGNKRNQEAREGGGVKTKPWSIRHAVRYFAGQEIDMKDPAALQKLLPEKPTVAQMVALNTLAKATKADMRSVEYVTEQIDGKIAQPNLNADLAAIQNMTDEQLDDYIRRFNEQYASYTGRGSPGDGGEVEEN